MTRYPAYQKYRNTGRDWFPKIPFEWRDSKLRWISTRYAGGTPDKNRSEYWEDGSIPWLNSGAVNQGTITVHSELITEEGFKNSSAKWIPIDALVMALAGQGKTKGMVAQTKIKTTCNQSMAAIVIYGEEPRFIYWWLCSQYKNIRGLTSDEGRDGLNLDLVGDIRCPLPSLDEQKAIACFLDFKTAQIDSLIAKKRSLLDKLAEKRTALISDAVTKGLDPLAAMKNSKVEWLGMVPAHWKVIPIKFALDMPITDGPHSTPQFYEEGIPFLSAESVKNDRLDFARMRGYISEEDHALFSKKYKPKFGDVYMVKSGATTGAVARVETHEEFNIWSPLAVLRPHPEKSTTDFLFYVLKSKPFFFSVELSWSYGTQQNIGMGVISNIRMALPPIEEQREICRYLKPLLQIIEEQREKVDAVIDKLQEYRSALITSAVTGKIDVRSFQFPRIPEEVAS